MRLYSPQNTLKLILAVFNWLALGVTLTDPSFPHIHQYGDYVSPNDIITRDVLIVGGGSSGTYSAIKLRDFGNSVAVVEKKGVLGGHTETWTEPVTQTEINAGVTIFNDLPIVRKYFARFQIPLTKFQVFQPGKVTKYVDFRTGKIVPGFVPPNLNLTFPRYAAQLAKYPYLDTGFDLPDPVPEELLLTFEAYAKRFHLENLLFFVGRVCQGAGDAIQLPAIYILKYISLSIVRNFQADFLTTTRRNNHELYDKALTELADDALLRSRVLAIDRNPSSEYAKILVQTPTGKKLIRAKAILITIPPLLKNLGHFSLDEEERSLFKQFKYSSYYTGILRNTGIPAKVSVETTNTGPRPFDLQLPGIYETNGISGFPNLIDVTYGSNYPLPLEKVKQDILRSFKGLVATEGKSLNATSAEGIEFPFLSDHSPFELNVNASAIRDGFYKRLYALQGRGRFWYTGHAWHAPDSGYLWRFSEEVVNRIVKRIV